MLPLPAMPFEAAVWPVAKVPNDYLASDGRNKYSVPYDLIGEKKVDIRITKTTVEVFYHGSRVAIHRIILKGASDNGKTYIACALGNAACRRFKKVRYVRMPELLDELSIARSAGELKKCLASYKKADLLILDEWLCQLH